MQPNYNSVVVTFCHRIASDLPNRVNDPAAAMHLMYIDDVVNDFILSLDGKKPAKEVYSDPPSGFDVTLQALVDLLYSFKHSREQREIPNKSDDLTKYLYSTYLSYLPTVQSCG